MVALTAIVACFVIVFGAMVALIVWNVETEAVTTVNSQLDNTIPQAKNTIEQGQQLDSIQSNVDDLNHANLAATKGTFNSAWSFGTPLMIVVIAALAIWKKLS